VGQFRGPYDGIRRRSGKRYRHLVAPHARVVIKRLSEPPLVIPLVGCINAYPIPHAEPAATLADSTV